MMKDSYCLLIPLLIIIACGKGEKKSKPQRKDLIEAVYASGYVTPENEYRLFALADGYLLEKMVEEGDTISNGQVLFRLDGMQQEAKLNYAAQLLRQAKENSSDGSPLL